MTVKIDKESLHSLDADTPLREAAPALLAALKDLLGALPSVQQGVCRHCGRQYEDILTGDCPSDDCPSFIARAAIADATDTRGRSSFHQAAQQDAAMNNAHRSNRLEVAILSLSDKYGDDPETALIDLMTDAMHWCDARRQDFHYLLAVAGKRYVHELNDDQTDERRIIP